MGGAAILPVRPRTRSLREARLGRALRSRHPHLLQARRVDKSDTQNAFGERAGDRADGWRDSVGTAHLFVTRGGAACDRERRVCFNDGEPDRRLTERFFGRRGKKDRD
jgi:hypothetical protein